MKEFNKRSIYRALARPYTPLGPDFQTANPRVFRKAVPWHESPYDEYFRYKVVLVEYEVADEDNWPEEDCHCNVALTHEEDDAGRKLVFIYISIKRVTPNLDQQLGATMRLLQLAHELLYPAQYQRIVCSCSGKISATVLKRECRLPNPDEEVDLVCSFITVAKFLQLLRSEPGLWVMNVDDLRKVQSSQRGQRLIRSFFFDRLQIAQEIAYDRTVEFLDQGLVQPKKFLETAYARCSKKNGSACVNASGRIQQCSGCPMYKSLISCFDEAVGYGSLYSYDEELLNYLEDRFC